ncbi:MAG: hypothetical protein U0176_15205 [Bacteroidia bacterium]
MFPSAPGEPSYFYASVWIGENEGGGLVGVATTVEDYIIASRKEILESKQIGPVKLQQSRFLVHEYGTEAVTDACGKFFNEIVSGGNVEELALKARIMFAHMDFFEYSPTWLDMSKPAIDYEFVMMGLRTSEGEWIDWDDLPQEIAIHDRCILYFELIINEVHVPFSIEMRPVEDMYDWMRNLALPAMVRRSQWGLDRITKSEILDILQHWQQHFRGSSEDEIVLRWTQMAHSGRGMGLLSTPLTPGGPVTFSGRITT